MTVQKTVVVVGAIPHPIGGVTNAIWRWLYAISDANHRGVLVDMHPSDTKYPLPVAIEHRVLRRWERNLFFPLATRVIASAHADVVHYHFSSIESLRYYGRLFLTRNAQRNVLTLHHGDQEKCFRRLDPVSRAVVRWTLGGFDQIVALSSRQAEFYHERLNVDDKRIVHTSGYLRPPANLHRILPASRTFDGLVQPDEALLLTSGYPTSIYGHEQAIRVTASLATCYPLRLVICLYGKPESLEYLARLDELARRHAHVTIMRGLDFADFTKLMGQSDVYLRPTQTDTTAITIADAINLGVPVVASNCTTRYPGTRTYQVGDAADFAVALGAVLADRAAAKATLARNTMPDDRNVLLRAMGLGST